MQMPFLPSIMYAMYIQAACAMHVPFFPFITLCIYKQRVLYIRHSSLSSRCVYIGSVRYACAILPFHRTVYI